MTKLWSLVTRVHWLVWAALAPLVIIGSLRLWTGGTKRIPVFGAGSVAILGEADAPEGTRLDLDVVSGEPFAQSAARFEEELTGYPDIVVVGLDPNELVSQSAEAEARETLDTLAVHAENATAVPVLLGFAPAASAPDEVKQAAARTNEYFRTETCRVRGLRVCVDLEPHAGDQAALREAITAGIAAGLDRHEQWRASTQTGR